MRDQGAPLKGQEAGTSLWNITDALKILLHPPSQLTEQHQKGVLASLALTP